MTTYNCSKCGKAVAVTEAGIKRPCDCDAPVIANLQAVARGAAVVNGVR